MNNRFVEYNFKRIVNGASVLFIKNSMVYCIHIQSHSLEQQQIDKNNNNYHISNDKNSSSSHSISDLLCDNITIINNQHDSKGTCNRNHNIINTATIKRNNGDLFTNDLINDLIPPIITLSIISCRPLPSIIIDNNNSKPINKLFTSSPCNSPYINIPHHHPKLENISHPIE